MANCLPCALLAKYGFSKLESQPTCSVREAKISSLALTNRVFCFFPVAASTSTPQKISANVGDNVILKCAFTFPEKVQPPYVIHWLKDGQKLPIYISYDGYPPHFGVGYEGRVSLLNQAEASLNLSDVRETDQGWYECKVFFLMASEQEDKNGTWVLLEVNCKYFLIFLIKHSQLVNHKPYACKSSLLLPLL